MTHYLSANGTSAAEALVIMNEGDVHREAQLLANRTGLAIIPYIQMGDSHWPDETIGDWGLVTPH